MQFNEAVRTLAIESLDDSQFTFLCLSCHKTATCYRGLDDEAVCECAGGCKEEEILGDEKANGDEKGQQNNHAVLSELPATTVARADDTERLTGDDEGTHAGLLAENGKVAHVNGLTKPKQASKQGYAIGYARYGIRVFPCHEIERDGYCSCGATQCASAGKHPRIKDWQILATCDDAEIRKWWAQWPDANVGVACGQGSNLTVLDVDGDVGRATLRELELEHGELPETPIALTGGGGCHYYFAFQRGPNNAVRFAPGLDIRTEGGLVVGVGSRNGKGNYQWEAAFQLGADGLAPSAMPQWLLDAIAAGQGNGKVEGGFKAAEKPIHAGEGRNNYLYKVGRSAKAKGYNPASIEALMRAENDTSCNPPVDNHEFSLLVAQVLRQPDQKGFQIEYQTNDEIAKTERALSIIVEDRDIAAAENAEYLKRPEIIEKLGYSQSIMLMIGGKHHGKTTNIRTLALSVMREMPIWGRETHGGYVVYAASNDEVVSTRNELLSMGWDKRDDPLDFVRINPDSDATPEQVLEDIANAAIKKRAVLIILDMLFDFVGIKDELSYAGTRGPIRMVQRLADETKCLVVGSHHTPKYLTDAHTAANAALGSQGIGARFSPIVLTRKWTDTLFTIESTTIRDPRGVPLPPSKIIRNERGWIELAGEFKEWMKWEMYAEKVMGLFEGGDPTEGFTVQAVASKLEIDRARAQNSLFQLQKAGKLTREKKGRGYRYYLAITDMFERKEGEWSGDDKAF